MLARAFLSIFCYICQKEQPQLNQNFQLIGPFSFWITNQRCPSTPLFLDHSTIHISLAEFSCFYNKILTKLHSEILKNSAINKQNNFLSIFTIKMVLLSLEQLLRGVFVITAPPTMGVGQCHESRKLHLLRPHFSKLAILPDYKCPGLICLALPARQKFGLILVIKFFLVEVIKKSS